ncbi:Hypothetical predicted protein, partial [Paramuricea clavata]
RMFADDTNITVSGKSIKEAEVAVNADLNNIREWLLSNRLSLNLVKTQAAQTCTPFLTHNDKTRYHVYETATNKT